MKATPAPMPVGDYCTAITEGKIVVNTEYQRSPKIWRGEARSFFIESIILGYPIPKIFLNSILTLKTRQTVKEIVDGQQRSMALRDFYNGKLRLSKNIETDELKGKNYNSLPDEHKEAFLSYSLPIDQFLGSDDTAVREAFRRMNSNNVPLNEEEKRHARYQGPFKWFVSGVASKFKDILLSSGVLSRRDFIRMGDYKLITDITFALINGIHTTKSRDLDHLYARYDKEFEDEEVWNSIVVSAIHSVLSRTELHKTDLFKAHIFYSLVLAQASLQADIGGLNEANARGRLQASADIDEVLFDDLLEILDGSDAHATHPFAKACAEKTNVREPREVRLAYLRSVLTRAN
jgi:hypothetical protein